MDGAGEREHCWIAVGSKRDLPAGGEGRSIEIGGQRIALFLHEGAVHAVGDACPHMGASLGMGVALAGEVTCPWHGWHFRLSDGRNTDGLDARVAVHPVRIQPDGALEVGLPAEPLGRAGSADASAAPPSKATANTCQTKS